MGMVSSSQTDNGSETQTAEAGWQVYPALYSIKKAALFIYWTPVSNTKLDPREGSGQWDWRMKLFP
jgi:hypothetical protein